MKSSCQKTLKHIWYPSIKECQIIKASRLHFNKQKLKKKVQSTIYGKYILKGFEQQRILRHTLSHSFIFTLTHISTLTKRNETKQTNKTEKELKISIILQIFRKLFCMLILFKDDQKDIHMPE